MSRRILAAAIMASALAGATMADAQQQKPEWTGKEKTVAPVKSGYAEVNKIRLYYEIHGKGEPMVLLHGGLGSIGMFGDALTQLAKGRQVIAVDLQGHGRTADVDRPIRYETMGDDIAALIAHLGFDRVDVVGYSLGGAVALRTAIQHPQRVRKLVVTSATFRWNGWYPEIVGSIRAMSGKDAPEMKDTPMFQSYTALAPDPSKFPVLLDKLGELFKRDYDWSKDVAAMKTQTLLVYADADMVIPSHIVEFYGLLGGGKGDAGWDGSGRSASQLAIVPGHTHYNIFTAPVLVDTILTFLNAPESAAKASK